MRFFVIFLVFSSLYSCICAQSDFKEFIEKYDKSYSSIEEYEIAKKNFRRNLRKVNKFNSKSNLTFTQDVNPYSDLDKETRSNLNGFQFSIFSHTFLTKHVITERFDDSSVPNELDWRDYDAVTPVQDQGYICGSCWAYATTGQLEGLIAIKTNKSAVKLSEQQFVDCNRHPLLGNYGCGGGFMATSLAYARIKDITTEEIYPYVGYESDCQFDFPQVRFNFSVPIMLPPGDENALKNAVAIYGPISVAIDGSLDSFFAYSDGVYFDPACSQKLNHAVLVIGYGTDPDGGDYWLIKNSWSEYWGIDGYVKLARNRNSHCGISKYAVYIKLH